MSKEYVSIRRSIQQAAHCIAEALAVIEAGEPDALAVEDLEHAAGLIQATVLRILATKRENR